MIKSTLRATIRALAGLSTANGPLSPLRGTIFGDTADIKTMDEPPFAFIQDTAESSSTESVTEDHFDVEPGPVVRVKRCANSSGTGTHRQDSINTRFIRITQTGIKTT